MNEVGVLIVSLKGSYYDPSEFYELIRSANLKIKFSCSAILDKFDPKSYVRSGKLDELKDLVSVNNTSFVVVNRDISSSQHRNIQRKLCCQLIDRTGLILNIFAQRARSFEGRVQVELAQLDYLKSKLTREWTHLERQRGGLGLRGPGETQLETDRRLLGVRIKQLSTRLKKIKSRRRLAGGLRKKRGRPTVALVGYTNAGKSSLFNVLTKSDIEARDLMFATLDPTTRAMEVGRDKRILLTDTVGFIENLPPTLIAAFGATLEETIKSQLILHVVDAAHPELYERIDVVNKILRMIGAGNVPTVMVYNKSDLLEGLKQKNKSIGNKLIDSVEVSAINKEGISLLKRKIEENLYGAKNRITVKLSQSVGRLRALFYDRGLVLAEVVDRTGDIILELEVDRFERDLVLKYKDSYELLPTDGHNPDQELAARSI